MKKEKMKSKMIMQVHDELVFDAIKIRSKRIKAADSGKYAVSYAAAS